MLSRSWASIALSSTSLGLARAGLPSGPLSLAGSNGRSVCFPALVAADMSLGLDGGSVCVSALTVLTADMSLGLDEVSVWVSALTVPTADMSGSVWAAQLVCARILDRGGCLLMLFSL
jgi:hypothetical protein